MKIQKLILSSGKCNWGKCHACGWGKLESPVNVPKLKQKVQQIDLKNCDLVKIFVSGSFLDNKQFPKTFRKWLADHLKKNKVKKLIIESRPEFITTKNLKEFSGINLTIAIGLESADNKVLKKYNKGFTYEDYLKAVEILHKNNAKVRTYLMVNIPFGTQKIFKESVKKVLPITDYLILINTFPHAAADLFNDWISGKWVPLNEKGFETWVKPFKSNKKVETDSQNYAFKPKFPKRLQKKLIGANLENLNHPYFEVWQDFFQRFYKRPAEKDYILFLPCSHRKPYTKSRTHMKIYGTLRNVKGSQRFHQVVVSNPGVIPIELSNNYPLNFYDWPEWEETPQLMKQYTKIIKDRVKKYLQSQKYKKVFAFMKYTQTYKAIESACKELKIPITNLLKKQTYKKIKDEKNPIINKLALKDLKDGATF